METDKGRLGYTASLLVLLCFALFLVLHLLYLYLADATRFPVNTIKISATYQHISHKQLETVLEKHMDTSFFFLPIQELKAEFKALEWIDTVDIEREWPDTLNITLLEKAPVAIWNDAMLLENGEVFSKADADALTSLPHLRGSSNQSLQVLHVYKKMSKILSNYDLQASALKLRKNEAWELELSNGVTLRLGKKYFLKRLERFCKAYPAVFRDRADKKAYVDLRYLRGMAIQWK